MLIMSAKFMYRSKIKIPLVVQESQVLKEVYMLCFLGFWWVTLNIRKFNLVQILKLFSTKCERPSFPGASESRNYQMSDGHKKIMWLGRHLIFKQHTIWIALQRSFRIKETPKEVNMFSCYSGTVQHCPSGCWRQSA